jgi:LmbE family N-acetylglucosaminyl deacetylase
MARILVIAPHPDDAEIGMGGTIALLADQGHDVLILDLTDGCPTPVGDRPTRLREADDALHALASPRVSRLMLDLPNRRVTHTLEARHKVAWVIRAHRAQVLFLPHPEDAHPDHLAGTRIAEDARFDAKLTGLELPPPAQGPGPTPRPPLTPGPPIYPRWVFYYYCSHLKRVPDPTFIMDTSATQERKRRSLAAYRSQFELNPANAGLLARLDAQDAYFGSRIGTPAGEPFWCREPLGLSGLGALPIS